MVNHQRIKGLPLVRACLIALLALALVGVQTAGVGHRIEHPTGADARSAQWQALSQHDRDCGDHDQDGGHAPQHDCSAYDAATLGDGPPLELSASRAASLPQPAPAAARVNAAADNSPHLPFHSRAPPRA